jgi:hypothetical protein
MRACVFAGPTLSGEAVPAPIARFGPAALGSIFRAVEHGYRRIGIVDGYFGNVPSVWHKEILWALSHGIDVAGAASMGALRAAELWPFGMRGIGRVFRLYRSGALTDDDEVAIVHAPEYLGFRPLSEAMCNVRFTLRRMVRKRAVDRDVARELAKGQKSLHFSERTFDTLAMQARRIAPARASAIAESFAREYVDVKKRDGLALVRYLTQASAPVAARAWEFPATVHWREQFERQLGDVPALR